MRALLFALLCLDFSPLLLVGSPIGGLVVAAVPDKPVGDRQ